MADVADIVYGVTSYERDRGKLPFLPVINMFAEDAPIELKPVLQSRPGLQNTGLSYGSGPVRQVFKRDNVLDSQLFAVSGSTFYSENGFTGLIDGTGPVSIAGYETFLFVSAGKNLWGFDGTTLTNLPYPDSAEVTKVVIGASRAITLRKDTGKFYWSQPLDDEFTALAFATAENAPDRTLDVVFVGDKLVLFGAETVEFWPVTTDNDLPFAPMLGRVFKVGVKATGCATTFNDTFAWVTNRDEVCIDTPEGVISPPGLQAKIGNSTSTSLWTFILEGTEYLVVRLDNESWVFNGLSKQWSTFESYSETNWIPQCFDGGVFGSSIDGRIIEWSDDHSDFGGVLERRFRAWQPVNAGGFPIFSLVVRTNPGHTQFLEGQYAEPRIQLRSSKDGGYVWTVWRTKSLGTQGNYRMLTRWNSLGMFSHPGAMLEVRVTDPVPFRVSDVTVNDVYGGP